MRAAVLLILPILMPSWRFFDVITASPRLEWRSSDDPARWVPLCPKPARLGFWRGLWRLFHNPWGNRDLFLASCAERLLDRPTARTEAWVWRRIAQVAGSGLPDDATVQFRIVLCDGHGGMAQAEVAVVSGMRALSDIPTS